MYKRNRATGLQRFRISIHLKICISCSIFFLTQTDCDSSLINGFSTATSKFQKSCLCNQNGDQVQVQTQASTITWTEFLQELTTDTFVKADTAIQLNTVNTQVLNITSYNGFYLIDSCSKSKNCGMIKKFIRFNKNCNPSEACRSNLNKRKLRVAGVLSEEYSYDTAILQKSDGSSLFQDSFSVELLKCLELTLNFTTIPIVTLSWGHLLPNNSWTGMIALLLSNEADLGLSSIADRPFRRAVVDFNIPTNEIRLAVFFQKPSSISSESTALLKPFQLEFWIAVFLLGFGMTFTTFVINKVLLIQSSQSGSKIMGGFCLMSQRKTESNEWTMSGSNSQWSKMDCVQWSISTFCLQGFYKVPKEVPLRIGMIVGSLSGFVIYSAYSGTLISFLSVVTEPIQNLGQLLSTDFTFAIVNEPLALKFFSDSPDSRNVMVYKRHNAEKTYSSMKEAYQKVVKGSFAFVTDHIGAYESLTNDFSVQEACVIKEIGIDNAQQKQGTLVQKNSPYKRVIDFQILRMIEYGLVRRWNSKYLKTKPACDNKTSYEGVELESVIIALSILGWGIVFGTLGLLLEINCFKLFRKGRQILPVSVW